MTDREPGPPQPPAIRYGISLHRWQWLGVPILLLIPVLALLGLFGETQANVSARSPELFVQLRYFSRLPYGLVNSLDFQVTNTTGKAVDRVQISLDTAYVTRFAAARAVPAFSDAYTIELRSIGAGETRPARVELTGEAYGRHRGLIRVSTGGRDTIRIQVESFVFP